jgi:hypothetical protein
VGITDMGILNQIAICDDMGVMGQAEYASGSACFL